MCGRDHIVKKNLISNSTLWNKIVMKMNKSIMREYLAGKDVKD